jgi:tRNA pseudouridine38-40 synthase
MYAHFDFEALLIFLLVHKLNSFLPKILWSMILLPLKKRPMLFDALKRTYEYHINTFKDPFCKSKATFIKN